jgi:hypothetical protein
MSRDGEVFCKLILSKVVLELGNCLNCDHMSTCDNMAKFDLALSKIGCDGWANEYIKGLLTEEKGDR